MKFRNLPPAAAVATLIVWAAHGLVIALPRVAVAQGNPTLTNVIPNSESATLNARITAINRKTRAVTLVGASGDKVTLIASPAVRLEMLKVGDRVNAQYYRSVAFVVRSSAGGNGTPVTDDQIT